MATLLNVVLPVFLVAGGAALAQTRLRLNAQTLSRAVFYLFAPALIFDSLTTSSVGGTEFGQIALILIVITAVLWALGAVASRLLKLSGPTQAAFLAAIVLMNAGNYGLSIDLFAFGEAGLARATLYFTISATLSSSLGVYLTARGRVPPASALRRVLGVPLVYAAALGLALNLSHWVVPEPLQKAIHLLGQASVPAMLTVLGVNLAETARTERDMVHWGALGVAVGLRLIVAPALAWLLSSTLGLNELTRDVVTLESAMPTAVITIILANEFESDPPFASMCVLVSTLASLLTLTVLLNWLI